MKLKMYLIGLGMGVIVTAVIMGIALSGRTREMSDEEIMARARQLGMVESGRLTEVNAGTENGQGSYVLTPDQTLVASGEQTAQAENDAVIEGEADDKPDGDGQSDDGGADGDANRADDGTNGASDATGEAGNESANSGARASDANGAGAQNGAGGNAGGGQNAAQQGNGAAASTTQGAQANATANAQSQTGAQNNAGADASSERAGQGSSSEQESQTVTGSIVVTIPDASSSETICELLQTAGVIDSATAFNNYLVQNGRDRYISTGAKLIPRGSSYEDVSRIITGR